MLMVIVEVGTYVASEVGKLQVAAYFLATEVRMNEWTEGGSDSDHCQPN